MSSSEALAKHHEDEHQESRFVHRLRGVVGHRLDIEDRARIADRLDCLLDAGAIVATSARVFITSDISAGRTW